jgi:hypothetical protein
VFIWLFWPGGVLRINGCFTGVFRLLYKLISRGRVRNMVYVVLYSADKAVIVYIVYSELYKIIILNNNYDYYSIDITASALYS